MLYSAVQVNNTVVSCAIIKLFLESCLLKCDLCDNPYELQLAVIAKKMHRIWFSNITNGEPRKNQSPGGSRTNPSPRATIKAM